jgi:CHAT domain-containing protein/tetratricopeptide (TPR) repeat protein
MWTALALLLFRAGSVVQASQVPGDRALADSLRKLMSRQQLREVEQSCRSALMRVPAGTPQYAEILDILIESAWRRNAGQPADAESLAQAAVDLHSSLEGDSSRATANALRALGRTQRNAARLEEARESLERAVALRERIDGDASLDLADDLLALASIEKRFSVDRAVQLQERVLAIREKLLKPGDSDIAKAQANLALIYDAASRRGEARRLFDAAVRNFDAGSPIDSAGLEQCLVLFTGTLLHLRDVEAAYPIAARAAEITRRLMPPDSPRLTNCVETLGYVEEQRGHPLKAVAYIETALGMLERGNPSDDESRARMLLHLGTNLRAIGNTDSSVLCYVAASRIYRDKLRSAGGEAEARWGEGISHLQRGEIALADSLLSRTLERRTQLAPPEAEAVFGNRFDLAQVRLLSGRYQDAIELSLQATRGSAAAVSADIAALTEAEALTQVTIQSLDCSYALSCLLANRDSSSVEDAWNVVAGTRALVLDEMAARRRRASESGDSAFVALMAQRARAATELSGAYFSDVRGQIDRKKLDDITLRRERIETDLAARNIGFNRDLERSRIGLAQARAGLEAGEALVGFVRFAYWDSDKARGALIEAGRAGHDGLAAAAAAAVPRYAAFVAYGHDGAPQFVPLGEATQIDALARKWRDLMGVKASGRDREGDERHVGEALRKAIWDPLVGAVAGAKTVLIVPDGELHMVNFAALPVGRNRYLVETGPAIQMLTSERDIPSLLISTHSGKGLLAVGGVDFDHRASLPKVDPAAFMQVASAGGLRGFQDCVSATRKPLGPLPGTLVEANLIADRWARTFPGEGKFVLTGSEATASGVLSRAATVRALHLATHGFFAKQCPGFSEDPGARQKLEEDPLLRSGIALAGANDRTHVSPNGDDGILTAEEIATSDLSSLDWVVLSACESGVGEVAPREGVYGLRRAFAIAGARTTIMSLWQVDDLATQRWMRYLYDARFTEGLPVAAAMMAASVRFLSEQRKRGRSTAPDAWGAFIATGAWR